MTISRSLLALRASPYEIDHTTVKFVVPQVRKSTLAQKLAVKAKARYMTLDDRAALDAALADPDGLVEGLSLPAVIDEVQRAPDLMRAVRKAVDSRRRPRMFAF